MAKSTRCSEKSTKILRIHVTLLYEFYVQLLSTDTMREAQGTNYVFVFFYFPVLAENGNRKLFLFVAVLGN